MFFKSYKINSIMSSVYDTVMKFLIWKVVWKLWKAFFWWRRPWSLEICRLAIILTPIQAEFFQFTSRLWTYLWDINTLKNNSEVRRFCYLYEGNQKIWIESTSLKYIKEVITIHSYVKISSLLASILGRSTASTRSLHIYMCLGVLLLYFQ